jgi:adenylate kinase family enzyme
MPRLHVLGASGSGTSTLGAALAERLGVPHHDSDSLYWTPTDPPFSTPRPPAERHALLCERLPTDGGWVFSGSALKWAGSREPFYELIVFLRLDPALRMDRLRRREAARYGARLEAGGDMAEASLAFMAWAESYDTAGPERRSLRAHEAWLARQTAPLLRLDSARPLPDLVDAVMRHVADLKGWR